MKLSTLLSRYRPLRRHEHDLVREGTTWYCRTCPFRLERDGETVVLSMPDSTAE